MAVCYLFPRAIDEMGRCATRRVHVAAVGEGSEQCSVWVEPREEKGEGQWQAWGPEKGRVDNRDPVKMAP